MNEALSPMLEHRIIELARDIIAVPVADDPIADSLSDLSARVRREGEKLIIPVWRGASERTIWSSPSVNHVFRALHDSHHLELGLGFDLESERVLADHFVGLVSDSMDRAIVRSEVWGQVEYFDRWGRFPDNQRAFVVRYVFDRSGALADGGL